jgi:hypothetical protein
MMLYIDRGCTYTEIYEPEHAYIFTGPCLVTRKEQTVTIPSQELFNLRFKEGMIQELVPSLNASEREFIKTGYSKEGWNQIFNNR